MFSAFRHTAPVVPSVFPVSSVFSDFDLVYLRVSWLCGDDSFYSLPSGTAMFSAFRHTALAVPSVFSASSVFSDFDLVFLRVSVALW
jgi:hypothetical protein